MAEDVYKISSHIAASKACKKAQCGPKAVNDKPSSVTIWRRNKLNDKLCTFDDIKEYLKMTPEVMNTRQKVFLAVKYLGKESQKGGNFFLRILILLRELCQDL